MRQIKSSGSVKAFYLNKDKLIKRLKTLCKRCKRKFPEITDIRLFGSLTKGNETGLSDIDLLIIVKQCPENYIERMKPYYFFFLQYLPLSVDIIVVKESELELVGKIFKESISIL